MKNFFLPAFIAVSLMASMVSCDSDNDNNEHKVGVADLPPAADSLVQKYFPTATYRLITKQNIPDPDGSVYDVTLSNNFEIDFDSNGKWIDIDGNHQPVPSDFIPQKIADYVTANYANQFVTSIDYERNHIEIEITNTLELIFDLEGNFVRIDH